MQHESHEPAQKQRRFCILCVWFGALAHLCAQLQRWDFGMIDCQMNTAHLASLGAREIARKEFISRLQELINYPPVTDFRFDTDLFA